jgi:surface protein
MGCIKTKNDIGVGEDEINLDDYDNDIYTCRECFRVPEIKSIDYDKREIIFECPKHGEKHIGLKTYLKQEKINTSKCECDMSGKISCYCTECKNFFCETCKDKHEHQLKIIDIKEINTKCHNHLKEYKTYCKKCREHFCEDCEDICGHNKVNISEPSDNDIQKIKQRIETGELLIKILKIILESYEKHKTNYFYSINIKNIADNDKNEILLAKLKNLENKISKYFDSKYKLKINEKSKEIKINQKELQNYELTLLSLIELKNLEKLSLKDTKITNIEPIKEMIMPNLKEIDLSSNKIKDVNSFEEILKKDKEIRYINLDENEIEKIDVFKKIFKEKELKKLQLVSLDNNKKLIEDDLKEIKGLINKENECTLIYKLGEDQEKHFFGSEFIITNKYNIKLEINGKIMTYDDFNNYKIDYKQDTIEIKLLINKYVTDLKCFFEGCSSLISINGISDWNTCDIINFSNFFKDCSLLKKIPDISNWDTSEVTDMSYMFNGCSSLTELPDISNWKTHKVEDMQFMFSGCSQLKILPNISKWNFAKVKNIRSIFKDCNSLTNKPDIRQWNLPRTTSNSYLIPN